jgi:hypothetical protein
VQYSIKKIKTSRGPSIPCNRIMNSDQLCPICGWFTKSLKARGQVNRHLKQWAENEDPGGHPRINTPEFDALMASRLCYSASRDESVQKLKRAARNQRYRANCAKRDSETHGGSRQKKPTRNRPPRKKKVSPEDKIAKAFNELRLKNLSYPC